MKRFRVYTSKDLLGDDEVAVRRVALDYRPDRIERVEEILPLQRYVLVHWESIVQTHDAATLADARRYFGRLNSHHSIRIESVDQQPPAPFMLEQRWWLDGVLLVQVVARANTRRAIEREQESREAVPSKPLVTYQIIETGLLPLAR